MRTLDDNHVKFSASVPFAGFPQLKGMIEKRKRWRTIDREWSYFKTRWKPKSWETTYRFIFTRSKNKKQVKGPFQLHLFEPRDYNFDYKVIVTAEDGSTTNTYTVKLYEQPVTSAFYDGFTSFILH